MAKNLAAAGGAGQSLKSIKPSQFKTQQEAYLALLGEQEFANIERIRNIIRKKFNDSKILKAKLEELSAPLSRILAKHEKEELHKHCANILKIAYDTDQWNDSLAICTNKVIKILGLKEMITFMGDIILGAADFHSLGEFMTGQKSQNHYEEVAAFYKHRAKIESDSSYKPNPSFQEYGQPAQYYATLGRDCIDRATRPGVSAGFRQSMYQQALKSYKDALKKYKPDHVAKIDTMTFSPDIFSAHIHDGIAEAHLSLDMDEEGKNSCDMALAAWDKVKEVGKKDINRDFEKTKLLGWKAICEAKLGYMEAAHDIFKSISNRWMDDEYATWLANIFLNEQEFTKATDVFMMLLSREAERAYKKSLAEEDDEDSGRNMAQKIIDAETISPDNHNEKYTSLIRFYKKALELADNDIGKMILNKNIASSYLTLEPKDIKSAYTHLKASWKFISQDMGDEIDPVVYKIGLLELLIPNRYLLFTENDFTCREIDIIEEMLGYIEEACSFEDKIDARKMPGFLKIKEQLIERQQSILQVEEAKIISIAKKVQLKKESLKAQKEKIEKEALRASEIDDGEVLEEVIDSAAAGVQLHPEDAYLEIIDELEKGVIEPVSTSGSNESESNLTPPKLPSSLTKAQRRLKKQKEEAEACRKRGDELRARQKEEKKEKEAADALARQEAEKQSAIEAEQRDQDALQRQRAIDEAEKQKLAKTKELQLQKKLAQTVHVGNAKTDEEIRLEEMAKAELKKQKAEQLKQNIAAIKALQQQVWNKESKQTAKISDIKEQKIISSESAAAGVHASVLTPNHAAAGADDNFSNNMSEASNDTVALRPLPAVPVSSIERRNPPEAGSELHHKQAIDQARMEGWVAGLNSQKAKMVQVADQAYARGHIDCMNFKMPKAIQTMAAQAELRAAYAHAQGWLAGFTSYRANIVWAESAQKEQLNHASVQVKSANQQEDKMLQPACFSAAQCHQSESWIHPHRISDSEVIGCRSFECHVQAHLSGECSGMPQATEHEHYG